MFKINQHSHLFKSPVNTGVSRAFVHKFFNSSYNLQYAKSLCLQGLQRILKFQITAKELIYKHSNNLYITKNIFLINSSPTMSIPP